jgi:hypothetical protein
MNEKEIKVPVALRRLEAKLIEWRNDKRGHKRIPKELWVEIEHIAHRHGVGMVSKVLNLSHTNLKRRIGKGINNGKCKQAPHA